MYKISTYRTGLKDDEWGATKIMCCYHFSKELVRSPNADIQCTPELNDKFWKRSKSASPVISPKVHRNPTDERVQITRPETLASDGDATAIIIDVRKNRHHEGTTSGRTQSSFISHPSIHPSLNARSKSNQWVLLKFPKEKRQVLR